MEENHNFCSPAIGESWKNKPVKRRISWQPNSRGSSGETRVYSIVSPKRHLEVLYV